MERRARAGPSDTRPGPGRDDGELLTALDGWLAGRTTRRIAADIWGADSVADWEPDHWLRSKTRRRVASARALMEHGWRDLAAGRTGRGA